MKIEHLALWTKDLERIKEFYSSYFNGKVGSEYYNPKKEFRSYFITFKSGSRLEIMENPKIGQKIDKSDKLNLGLAHMAFSVGSKENVDKLTNQLRKDGYTITGEPRTTGDGYYESSVLDPDGNHVEITI